MYKGKGKVVPAYTMKAAQVQLHPFLNLALEGGVALAMH